MLLFKTPNKLPENGKNTSKIINTLLNFGSNIPNLKTLSIGGNDFIDLPKLKIESGVKVNNNLNKDFGSLLQTYFII